jgi:hypothetical protein
MSTRWHLEPNGSYWREWRGWKMQVEYLGMVSNHPLWRWMAVNMERGDTFDSYLRKELGCPTPHAAKCAATRACKEAEK